jgi:hypothetical protein
MTVKPVSDWASSYKSGLEAYYARAASNPTEDASKFWQDWMDENTQGIEMLAPYSGSGVTTKTDFAPVSFSPSMMAPQSAKVLADCWQSYVNAITWSPPPPAPPFSVITAAIPSTLGITAAYSALLSGLIAEFLIMPPDPTTALVTKAAAISALFYTATISSGVQLDGLAIPGAPPPPLTVPYTPVG